MKRYTVEVLRSGQPRAYADSYYEFVVTVEQTPLRKNLGDGGGNEPKQPEWEPLDLNVDLIIPVAKLIGHNWVEMGEPGDNWAAPHLTSKSKLGPGKWKFLVTEVYTD